MVSYLLQIGVCARSVKRVAGYPYTAMDYAIANTNTKMAKLLYQKGSSYSVNNIQKIIESGNTELLEYVISILAQLIFFWGNLSLHEQAFRSGSVVVVEKVLAFLKSHNWLVMLDATQVSGLIAYSGSITLFTYAQEHLLLPLSDVIKIAIPTDSLSSGLRCFETSIQFCRIKYVRHLIEVLGLMPSQTIIKNLNSLNLNGEVHEKLVTHAYILSLQEELLSDRALLLRAADCSDLKELSTQDLFRLFVVLDKNIPTAKDVNHSGITFKDFIDYVIEEIASRDLDAQALASLINKEEDLAHSILFYLMTTGEGFQNNTLIHLLRLAKFRVNTLSFSSCYLYKKTADQLIRTFQAIPHQITKLNLDSNQLSKFDKKLPVILAAIPDHVTEISLENNDVFSKVRPLDLIAQLHPYVEFIHWNGACISPYEILGDNLCMQLFTLMQEPGFNHLKLSQIQPIIEIDERRLSPLINALESSNTSLDLLVCGLLAQGTIETYANEQPSEETWELRTHAAIDFYTRAAEQAKHKQEKNYAEFLLWEIRTTSTIESVQIRMAFYDLQPPPEFVGTYQAHPRQLVRDLMYSQGRFFKRVNPHIEDSWKVDLNDAPSDDIALKN